MEASKITSKGQIVIPTKLRRKHGLKPGIKVLFIERNDEIFLQSVTKEYVRSVHGMLASEDSGNRRSSQRSRQTRARGGQG